MSEREGDIGLLFPHRIIAGADRYLDAYSAELARALGSVSRESMRAAENTLLAAFRAGGTVFSCGNGGSAAIANHLLCDWLKGVQNGTSMKPRVQSLSSSPELMSAIANDIGVEDIFSLPLRSLARAGDVLLAISSSGSSPNIVSAVRTAKKLGLTVVAMTGFDGGVVAVEADISLYVAADNYGVVEDVHQTLMHVLAQSLRMNALEAVDQLGKVRF